MKPGEVEQLKADNTRLKAENNRLKKQFAGPEVNSSAHSSGFIKKTLCVVLVLVAAVTLTAGNLLLWAGNTIVKPDRFAAATAPIIKDPQVQKTMALYTTNSIFNNIDAEQITASVLPPRADFLAPQLTAQLKAFTQGTLQKALDKPSLQDKWNTVLANQHQRLINFASKYQGDGDISLNDVFNQLTASLADTKLAFLAGKKLPAKVGDIAIISAPWLPAFHNVVVHIDTWRLLLIIFTLLSLTIAVWLSVRRRRTIYLFCLTSGVLILTTMVGLYAVKSSIINRVDPPYGAGVGRVLQIFLHPLVAQTATLLALLGLVSLVAWVSSPARSAAKLRQSVLPLFGTEIHQQIFHQDTGFSLWFQKNKYLLEWSVIAIFSVIMLLVVRLTLLGLIAYSLSMLVLILLIETVAGGRPQTVSE
jgi:hypothetical protein